MIDDDELRRPLELSDSCPPDVWEAVIEGRDQDNGDSFIQTGHDGSDRREKLYVFAETTPVGSETLELIASAHTALPSLEKELMTWRSGRDPFLQE